MMDGFYRAFEDKHRGSREIIKKRQKIYLPLVRPLTKIYSQPAALDLGCGRGEWLELLTEAGFFASGIDLDDGMLAECRARGMNVRTQDALSALQSLPDSSQAVISGFHFAEHIPFDVLRQIVQEALRALKPAGLLILETPNPENVLVGSSNFYLDPSHNRPIPPLLMEFLPEYYGFYRVKTMRLQEPVHSNERRLISIHDVLGGVSPDYAVVAQKGASLDVLKQVSSAFEKDYGITLGMLAGRYESEKNEALSDLNLLIQRVDRDLDRRIVLLDQHLQRVDQHLQQIEARRPISLLKRLIKKVARPFAKRIKERLASNHAQHEMLVRVARVLGLYKLISWTLNKAAPVVQPAAEPSEAVERLDVAHREQAVEHALVEQPNAVRKVFEEIDVAIKKSERS
jgi:SAM-dependent methyltransferase